MGKLHVMDRTGDRVILFDEIDNEIARKTFDKLRQKGYLAYEMDADTRRGEQLIVFDKTAETVIMNPPLMGG